MPSLEAIYQAPRTNQHAAPRASDLSLSPAGCDGGACRSCLLRRHHLHPGAARDNGGDPIRSQRGASLGMRRGCVRFLPERLSLAGSCTLGRAARPSLARVGTVAPLPWPIAMARAHPGASAARLTIGRAKLRLPVVLRGRGRFLGWQVHSLKFTGGRQPINRAGPCNCLPHPLARGRRAA